jgi:hypothetical protein
MKDAAVSVYTNRQCVQSYEGRHVLVASADGNADMRYVVDVDGSGKCR